MWTQTAALLLACCLGPAQAQSIWDNPITFNSKAKDACTMAVTGQGEYTKLRLLCQSSKRSYWCEYLGKPYACRAYNKNPRHFFVQMMWVLRKHPNACQGPRSIKPHMCRKEPSDDSQMVFTAASFAQSEASPRTAQRPGVQPARPRPDTTGPGSARRAAAKVRVPPRARTTQRAAARPTPPPTESHAKRLARQYCWRSMRGVCSFIIGFIPK
ncbi:fibroblast growth factor binding protein 2a [Salarias fasciatus]|uniref:fibroblast growth factor binding protein 2a n=1 Tax=Salarias fasciatus TaxID=181472 RepID=UPI001176AAF6|nr:fibroblast growth factor-binding protein 2 [Salarias fasciatus]